MCFYNLTSAFGHQLNFFFGLFYFISFFCFTPSLNCLNNNYRKQVIYLTGRSCCRKEKSRDLKVARFLTSLRHYTVFKILHLDDEGRTHKLEFTDVFHLFYMKNYFCLSSKSTIKVCSQLQLASVSFRKHTQHQPAAIN